MRKSDYALRMVLPLLRRLATASLLGVGSVTALAVAPGGCASSRSATSITVDTPPTVSAGGRTAARPPATEPSAVGAVTHLGRTALARADLAVRGRVARISPPVRGTEVAQVEVMDVLYPDPEADSVEITVFGSQPGFLPPVGQEAIFLLKLRERSNNFNALDVAPLSGPQGAARLETFRAYVSIEAVPDGKARIEALLRYLRTAVLSTDKWTRWNAAREYAAFSKVHPGALTVEGDGEAVSAALRRARSPALRELLNGTLDVTGARRSVTGADDRAALLAELDAAYEKPGAEVATRRAAVIDAAARCGPSSLPLIEKSLGAPEPAVREAGVAGAAELGLRQVGPRLAQMLSTEDSADVRRSLVRALGYLREPAAVASLAALAAQEGGFSREACFALARIRSEEAAARLRQIGREARDTERRELVQFLLSDAFAEQEKALGR